MFVCVSCGGQRPIKVLDPVRRVKRGGYGLGAGDAGPLPTPAYPWRRGTAQGLGAQGHVGSSEALPCPDDEGPVPGGGGAPVLSGSSPVTLI